MSLHGQSYSGIAMARNSYVRRASIQVGLNFIFRCSKWIALTAAVFLLFSNLDNVPDCPELLNWNSASAVLSLVHHSPSKSVDAIHTASSALPEPETRIHHVSVQVLVLAPPGITRSLYQAADPSPPRT